MITKLLFIIFLILASIFITIYIKILVKKYKIIVTTKASNTKASNTYPTITEQVLITHPIYTTIATAPIKEISSDYEDVHDFNNNTYLCDNCSYVNQSVMKISQKQLYTNSVGSCSILMFHHNNLNFMAHIDGGKNTSKNVIQFIKDGFSNYKSINAIIIKGPWCNDDCNSIKIILNSLNNLNISYMFYKNEINWENTILFDKTIIID